MSEIENMSKPESDKAPKKKRSFGDRLALIALAAMISAAAVIFFYYIGF